MRDFEDYLEKAMDMAEEAGEIAKKAAGEAVDKVKEFTEEGGKARELVKNAKEEAAAVSFGAKEKVQGMLQDAKAIKEIKQGIAELEALPEIEGSILYTMEKETLSHSLRSLALLIDDSRLDNASVEEEIRKVMVKVVPDAEQAGGQAQQKTEEELAMENARMIAYNSCVRALGTLGQNK